MKQHLLLSSILALGLAACGGEEPASETYEERMDEVADADTDAVGMAEDGDMAGDAMDDDMAMPGEAMMMAEDERRALLDDVVNSELRSDNAKARDQYRNPVETLLFFGVQPSDTVVEVWPGGGWYTDIIAPYLAAGGGTLYAAGFDPDSDNERVQTALGNFRTKYVEDSETYGTVEMSVLAQSRQDVAPAGSADVVLTFRNVHNWEMGGWGQEAFDAFYDALKPGGTLGIVEHRLPEDRDKAMEQSSGYMKVSTVREMAENAGFVFDASSEINANEMDTADHPYGVWTLPPRSRMPGEGDDGAEDFDAEKYRAIGESDRMTLRFKKPIEPEDSMLE